MKLIINGTDYGATVTSCSRSIDKEYKYNLTAEDGCKYSEVKSIRLSYTVTIGGRDQETYDNLVDALATYDEVVEVMLPYNQGYKTLQAIAEISNDSILFIESGGTVRWDGLTVKFTSVNPMTVTGDGEAELQ